MVTPAMSKLKLWFGWHGFTECEQNVEQICRMAANHFTPEEILANCLAFSSSMSPPSKRKR